MKKYCNICRTSTLDIKVVPLTACKSINVCSCCLSSLDDKQIVDKAIELDIVSEEDMLIKTIAQTLIKTASTQTSSGNWICDYDDVEHLISQEDYSNNLNAILDEILCNEKVMDCTCDEVEESFDLVIDLDLCPNCEPAEEQSCATYYYYEDGQEEIKTIVQLREYFEINPSVQEQRQQGTTFEDWISELLKMQILVEIKKVNDDSKIIEIGSKEANSIIDSRKPLGIFYHLDGEICVGIDNSTGDAWTEEFKSVDDCKKWLIGEPIEDIHGILLNG
ncbi:MAG: hypothetical protein AB9836_04755 [Aminipila sp.]